MDEYETTLNESGRHSVLRDKVSSIETCEDVDLNILVRTLWNGLPGSEYVLRNFD